ncbi:MAG: NAD(P)H-dependent oxidoreductase subunit E [Desulfotomaculaceae bacterium]|nr:NAD(P)H-dependent oxidoreductase subunit E [Desulfotomaculaceae bacterium]
MLVIQVCVGSSCFLRGSKNIITEIKNLIVHYQLDDIVTLKGNFCLEKCSDGVTIMIGEKMFTKVTSDNIVELFENEVFSALYGGDINETDQH